eukprot:GILJ01000176.1.p1 GENE.GILJ01000176.1~~GILJ01000176.1.p1  ORF type:complete len:403 (-),score=103.08 GILJ01000176.1:80-1177(-)
MAADITNSALEAVVAAVAPGASVVDLCAMGDRMIEEKTSAVYNKGPKGKIEKGIAFPTCISINEVVGHFSPLTGESVVIQDGDVVKIDLGTHLDGFVATGAHTVVAGGAPATGRKADVILAAHTAAEAALRLLQPGNKNTQITEAIQKIADAYRCQPVEGVLSHQTKRHIIDGNRCIINKQTLEQKVDDFEFELNEAYGIDIVISTGEGKTREREARTTVYKRAVENNYNLKMKASRQFFSQVNAKFPTLPFTIRAIDDEKIGRMGVVECLKHDLLHPYPVLYENNGEFVAQFKFTVLLLPGGTTKITGLPLTQQLTSEHKVEDPEVLSLLQKSTNKRKQKKNRKKKAAAAGGDKDEEEEEKQES